MNAYNALKYLDHYMLARKRPNYINYCPSIDDFHAGRISRLPIDRAEEMIAHHRKVHKFTWCEDFSLPPSTSGYIYNQADTLCIFEYLF